MRRSLLLLGALVLVLVTGIGVAVARSTPRLTAGGPTSVTGTDATAVFAYGPRTLRQVRYDDRGTLRYTFRLTNHGNLPVTVHGLPDLQQDARLFRYVGLTDADGNDDIHIGAGEERAVTLALRMTSCETLSARSGSFMSQVTVHASWVGPFSSDVTVDLPEEIHTGSPREAFCPRATATSRPPG